MRITIFTAGSSGDVLPCLQLGKGLQRAGFQVRLAAPQNFAGLIQEGGLSVHPLRGDVQQIMASDRGRSFMENGSTNPIRAMLAMRRMLGPVALNMAEDALVACRGADALISLAVFAPFGSSMAEILGIPLINVEPTPLLPTRSFQAPGWPVQRSLGGQLNRLSGHAMLQLIWQWYGPYANEFRAHNGLPPLRSTDFYRILSTAPLLGAYSTDVIPRPPDWPAGVHITGYWFQDVSPNWQPSRELERFLDQGEPPVYVGFGSMGGQNPEILAEIVLEALANCGQRGLLLTGWGGMQVANVPESLFVLDSAPHAWLFPRMAVVVHHGGAGTTAEGLRAGVPAVVVPFIVDQPFWGKRIQSLGVGPQSIPAKKLSADNLAAAIRAATRDTALKERAAALGAQIRAEDGVGNAVKIIQQHLGG